MFILNFLKASPYREALIKHINDAQTSTLTKTETLCSTVVFISLFISIRHLLICTWFPICYQVWNIWYLFDNVACVANTVWLKSMYGQHTIRASLLVIARPTYVQRECVVRNLPTYLTLHTVHRRQRHRY